MSKYKVFVVVFAAIIIGAFVVSCFLMTIVNPPPLKPLTSAKSSQSDPTKTKTGSFRRYEDNFSDISNPLESLAPFYRFKVAKLSPSPNVTYIEEDSDPLFKVPDDMIKEVLPPLYPIMFTPTVRTTASEAIPSSYLLNFTPTTITTTYEHKATLLFNNESYTKLNNSLKPITLEDTQLPNSDFISFLTPAKNLRRSVNNFFNKVIDGISSDVTLKIINKYGKPRIEIKINAEDAPKNKEDMLEVGSGLEMIVQKNNSKDEKSDLDYITEIKILPNNTVFIDSGLTLSDGESENNFTEFNTEIQILSNDSQRNIIDENNDFFVIQSTDNIEKKSKTTHERTTDVTVKI